MKTKSIMLLLTAICVSVMLSAQTLPDQEQERMSDEKYKACLLQNGFDHFHDNPFLMNPYVNHRDVPGVEYLNAKYNDNQSGDFVSQGYEETDSNRPIGKPFRTKPMPRIKAGFRTATSAHTSGGGY